MGKGVVVEGWKREVVEGWGGRWWKDGEGGGGRMRKDGRIRLKMFIGRIDTVVEE